ncbi:MAG: SH3 domain-containing protein [Bacteroidota bacterium]|nr:SH3 domain-containing protein [Bacteroidota bacterium]
MKNILPYFSGLLLLISFPSAGQPFIADQSYLDESFYRFRIRLEHALLTQDTTALFSMLHDSISTGNDSCYSKECFISDMYMRPHPDSSMFWESAMSIMKFGFRAVVYDKKYPFYGYKKDMLYFQAPSYLGYTEKDSILLIMGKNVNIREKPTLSARVIRRSTYGLYRYNGPWPDPEVNAEGNSLSFTEADGYLWIEILLRHGRYGYVAAEYTSLIYSREMTIARIKGKWKIVSYYLSPVTLAPAVGEE